MELISIFLVSFTIALSGALMPGPLLTAVISESIRRGKYAGPLISLGHAILEIFMVILILFSLNRFVHNPVILKSIALLGVLILFITGIQMLFSLRKLEVEFKEVTGKVTGLVFTGITMSLANPYWTIWWMTIGLGLVLSAQKAGMIAIGVFFIGHILADFAWYTAVSLMVSRGRSYLSGDLYRTMIGACAVILIVFAGYFGWAAIGL